MVSCLFLSNQNCKFNPTSCHAGSSHLGRSDGPAPTASSEGLGGSSIAMMLVHLAPTVPSNAFARTCAWCFLAECLPEYEVRPLIRFHSQPEP
jgi:hypothetical protein